ncbi:ATP-dependent Clp protease proteolytic subunit [Patescibacteria group bacterium]|nr:ATP-dependent Clp protease proteolytic subunit [Patescibacteria group bacterium]
MNKARLFWHSRKTRSQDKHETEEYGYSDDSGEIIHDEKTRTIGFIGGINQKQLANFHTSLFDFFKKSKPITLFICSYGGDISAATAIYDLIKMSPVPITTIGYGHLASGGLIIYLAGSKRLLLPQTRLIFHWAVGDSHNELDEDFLKRESGYFLNINQALKKIIEENTKLSARQIKKFMHDFKTLSAEEAVRYGLAHEITRTLPVNFQKPKRKK